MSFREILFHSSPLGSISSLRIILVFKISDDQQTIEMQTSYASRNSVTINTGKIYALVPPWYPMSSANACAYVLYPTQKPSRIQLVYRVGTVLESKFWFVFPFFWIKIVEICTKCRLGGFWSYLLQKWYLKMSSTKFSQNFFRIETERLLGTPITNMAVQKFLNVPGDQGVLVNALF